MKNKPLPVIEVDSTDLKLKKTVNCSFCGELFWEEALLWHYKIHHRFEAALLE